MEEKKIGNIVHFFGKVMVAALEITDGELSVGDTIHIKGKTSDFTMKVESMQIEHQNVEKVSVGDSVGIKVPEPVRDKDEVFLVTGE